MYWAMSRQALLDRIEANKAAQAGRVAHIEAERQADRPRHDQVIRISGVCAYHAHSAVR